MLNFRNDYSVAAHPKALEAIVSVNGQVFPGYGSDVHCDRAAQLIREQCACPDAAVHFFVGGTPANLTAIAAFLRPWEAVISADSAHIHVHEAGSIEATGHKILAAPTEDGKLRVSDIESILAANSDPSFAVVPRLVYVSQATEIGTVYSRDELSAISKCCKENRLYLFVDGARLACGLNAAGLTLSELARLVDAFYLGGTKNGMLIGEAMVITSKELQPYFATVMKRQGAVLAKGFLIGLQFAALLEDGLYWELARHANAMGQKLQAGLESKGYPLMIRSATNQIFIVVPDELLPKLQQLCSFEIWGKIDAAHTAIRFVTSFATAEEDVDALLAAL